jgi:ribosomal protein S17E
MKWLVTEKTEAPDHVISEDTSGTARLLMKVMTKKLNEKYSGVLNEQQKSLIKAYAFSAASEDNTSIKMKLSEVKSELLSLIEQYGSEITNNDYLKNKLTEAKAVLLSESIETVDDDTVTRFMLYSRLKDELETKE